MFCWLCISILLRNKNQLDALFILSLFRQSTSTCFGHICSPSSGGILYMYNTYQLSYIYSKTPDYGLQICPKHVEVDWLNKLRINILTFCWPCISVYLSQYLTNLMLKICFTISFISCLYMFRAHVLIIRRSKLHYTASGIITPLDVMIPDYCETNFVHQVG